MLCFKAEVLVPSVIGSLFGPYCPYWDLSVHTFILWAWLNHQINRRRHYVTNYVISIEYKFAGLGEKEQPYRNDTVKNTRLAIIILKLSSVNDNHQSSLSSSNRDAATGKKSSRAHMAHMKFCLITHSGSWGGGGMRLVHHIHRTGI